MLYRLVVTPQQIEGNLIYLKEEQEHYLRRVVRLSNEDYFIAMDGHGNCWQVQLTLHGGNIVELLTDNRELPVAVTLIVALPKGSGFEEIIRCTTELGVHQLQPVISDRTLLKPSPNKLDRWRKIAQEAAEQSERQIVPYIASPIYVQEAFSRANNLNIPKYIAFARSCTPHLQHFLNRDFFPSLPGQMIIATGCEGGWTKKEVEQAINCNFQEVSLGKRILRAVTAPIMAMALIAGTIEQEVMVQKSE